MKTKIVEQLLEKIEDERLRTKHFQELIGVLLDVHFIILDALKNPTYSKESVATALENNLMQNKLLESCKEEHIFSFTGRFQNSTTQLVKFLMDKKAEKAKQTEEVIIQSKRAIAMGDKAISDFESLKEELYGEKQKKKNFAEWEEIAKLEKKLKKELAREKDYNERLIQEYHER